MNVDEQFGRAIRHAQAGEFSQAEAVCREIVAAHPDHADSLHVLGLLAMEGGRNEEAVDHLRRAVALQGSLPHFHYNLGVALRRSGEPAQAAVHYRKAIELNPQYPQARTNLASVLVADGNFEEAYREVVGALAVADLPEARTIYLSIASAAPEVAAKNPGHLLHALTSAWGRPSELASACIHAVRSNQAIAALIREASSGWVTNPPAAFAVVAREPLLRGLLEAGALCDFNLEFLVTSLRAAMLQDAASRGADSPPSDAAILQFQCALARQCFINEYVFVRPTQALEAAEKLQDRISSALQDGSAIAPVWLAAVAAYMPLHSIRNSAALLKRSWPEPVRDLLRQQIEEPLDEAARRSSIRVVAPVEDATSKSVQRQYEENPFPRWVRPVAAAPRTFDKELRATFPGVPLRMPAKGNDLDILIAGCGTGQQVVEIAQLYPGARIFAIDLSTANLAHAQRHAHALGLSHIEFAQCDVLKAGSIGRSFDLIEAVGVLHHMRDPWAGWRTLLSLLRRDGIMYIGLYSKLARRNIESVRRMIVAGRIPATADGIRRARQDLIALPETAPERDVVRMQDFYGVSACRDLLFHVQERQLELPEIRAFLAGNGLELVGMVTNAATARRYRERFPADKAATDLDSWHALEADNPDTFIDMYRFYVQQAAPSVN